MSKESNCENRFTAQNDIASPAKQTEEHAPYPSLSIVIPCYCSTSALPETVQCIHQTVNDRLDELKNHQNSPVKELVPRDGKQNQNSQTIDYEIILVNDGSPDNGATQTLIKELSQKDSRVVAVDLARNFGQQAALMAGFAQVKGEIIVCMDDDGQTPAEEMFKLIDKVVEGYDIVFASYGKQKQHSLYRRLGSSFNRWCEQRFMETPKDLETTSYIACKRFAVDSALTYTNPYPFVVGLLFRSVQTYANVPIHHKARKEGESGYTLKKLVSLWVNGCTSFSIAPLRAATILGFICSLTGFILTLLVVIQKFIRPDIEDGWSSLMAAMLFLGGLIMLILGLLGEYVGRIYLGLNNAPQYVVRSITKQTDGSYQKQPHAPFVSPATPATGAAVPIVPATPTQQ